MIVMTVIMQEVQLPRELAFMIRNRLKLKKIPYKEVRIDKIALDQNHVGVIEEIISDLRERGIAQAKH